MFFFFLHVLPMQYSRTQDETIFKQSNKEATVKSNDKDT